MSAWNWLARLLRRPARPAAWEPDFGAAPPLEPAGRLPLPLPVGAPLGLVPDDPLAIPIQLELDDGLSVQVVLTEDNAGRMVHATQELLTECRRRRRAAEPEAAWLGLGEDSPAFA